MRCWTGEPLATKTTLDLLHKSWRSERERESVQNNSSWSRMSGSEARRLHCRRTRVRTNKRPDSALVYFPSRNKHVRKSLTSLDIRLSSARLLFRGLRSPSIGGEEAISVLSVVGLRDTQEGEAERYYLPRTYLHKLSNHLRCASSQEENRARVSICQPARLSISA